MKYDSDLQVWDVVIIDSKLSSSTGFTSNQATANGLDLFYLKTSGITIKQANSGIPDIGEGISKNGAFKKIYSDGNGNFTGGGVL